MKIQVYLIDKVGYRVSGLLVDITICPLVIRKRCLRFPSQPVSLPVYSVIFRHPIFIIRFVIAKAFQLPGTLPNASLPDHLLKATKISWTLGLFQECFQLEINSTLQNKIKLEEQHRKEKKERKSPSTNTFAVCSGARGDLC